MPAIGQIQRRGWCPKTITTSVGLADNAAGGQIHLPTVSNTINSESTNIDRREGSTGAARISRFRWRIVGQHFPAVVRRKSD
jgi:hypothetical protein